MTWLDLSSVKIRLIINSLFKNFRLFLIPSFHRFHGSQMPQIPLNNLVIIHLIIMLQSRYHGFSRTEAG